MKPIHFLPFYQSLLTKLRLVALGLLILCLPVACSKKDDVAPQTTCKVTSATFQGIGNPSTDTWEYGADGQLKSILSASGYKTSYGYDANGYLTAVTNIDANSNVTNTGQFEYTGGQLTRFITKNAAQTTLSNTQYEYDALGDLTRSVEQYVGGNTYTYLFSAGKQTGYIAKSGAGVESQPYTFENGLVKRAISGTSQANYEYDAQGRRTRYEIVTNGKLANYTVYEYTDGMSPDRAQPSFKGISDLIVRGSNQSGTNTGLVTRQTHYTVNATNVATRYSEIITRYAKNASGFPSEATTVTTYYESTGGVSSTSTEKHTYLYTGCP